jgi:hypothetical protein
MWREKDWASFLPVLFLVSSTSALITYLLVKERQEEEKSPTVPVPAVVPRWYAAAAQLSTEENGSELIHVEEWQNENGVYRQDNGWSVFLHLSTQCASFLTNSGMAQIICTLQLLM